MRRAAKLLAVAALAVVGAASPAARATGPVHRAPVALEGPGPFYRLPLPVEVPLSAAWPDLRDVHVEDATGTALSFALVPAHAVSTDAVAAVSPRWVPLFASDGAPDALAGFRVERRPDGTVTAVVADPAAAPRAGRRLRGYLLEVPGPRARCTSLDLDWYRKTGAIEQLSVDASDDLESWRPWRRGATLASLEYAGQRIEKRTLDLPGEAARYVRLTWEAPAEAPELVAASLSTTTSVTVQPETLWSEPFPSTPTPQGTLEVDLGRDVALARVRVELAEDNALAPVEVWTGAGREGPLGLAGRGVVYRLRLDGRTSEEREIKVTGTVARRLSIRPQTGGHLGAAPPAVSVGVAPVTLVFLARGASPYALVDGEGATPSPALDVSTLVPGWGGPAAPTLSAATVDLARAVTSEAPAPIVPPKKLDPRPYLLWGVLAAGVLALVALALKVLREATGTRDGE